MDDLKNIKIVFIDIDGTLLNDKKHVTVRTRKSIKKIVDKGILVVLVSGRNITFCIDKSRRALASPIVISSNGTEVYDYESNKILYQNIIDKDVLKKIWDFSDKNEIGVFFNSIEGRFINKYLIGFDKHECKVVTTFKELNKLDVSQFVIVSNDYDKTSEFREFIKSFDLDIAYFSKSFGNDSFNIKGSIDIINKDVSKGSGINELLKILNIDKSESLCFGDYINDKEMFMACGYKVAMGNACNEIKELADFVTLSNNKNGIAYFLNKYL